MTNTLRQIFDTYETDKGYKHGYDSVYELLWNDSRNEPINFLEVGIFKGAGLGALHEYFINGNIYGIDIFVRHQPEEIHILQNDRIYWAKGSSTDPKITDVLRERFSVKFDYILDDGQHTPEANMLTFRYLSPLLKRGGLYIIEDVFPLELMSKSELNIDWLRKHPNDYSLMKNREFLQELENSGMTIERYDLRITSGEPDSYIITLRKD